MISGLQTHRHQIPEHPDYGQNFELRVSSPPGRLRLYVYGAKECRSKFDALSPQSPRTEPGYVGPHQRSYCDGLKASFEPSPRRDATRAALACCPTFRCQKGQQSQSVTARHHIRRAVWPLGANTPTSHLLQVEQLEQYANHDRPTGPEIAGQQIKGLWFVGSSQCQSLWSRLWTLPLTTPPLSKTEIRFTCG